MAQYWRDFSSDTLGQQPSDIISKWSTVAGEFQVVDFDGARVLRYQRGAGGSNSRAFALDGIVCQGAVQERMVFRGAPGGSGEMIRTAIYSRDAVDRAWGAYTHFAARRLQYRDAANSTTITNSLDGNLAGYVGTDWWVMLTEVVPEAAGPGSDTMIRSKWWKEGTPEPEWTLTGTGANNNQARRDDPNAPVFAGGWVGVRMNGSQTADMYIKSISVGTNGDLAPAEDIGSGGGGDPDPEEPTDPDIGINIAWHGATTSNSFSITAEPSASTNLIFEVSTNSNFSTIQRNATLPASQGSPARFDATGLSSGTRYYWRVRTHSDTKSGNLRTFPAGASNLVIALSSCSRGSSAIGSTSATSNARTYDRIRERNPDLFIHMGDMHYRDIGSNNEGLFAQAFRDVVANPRPEQFFAEVPWAYSWDDHDYGPNNSDSSSPGRPAALSSFRKFIPHYPLQSANGHVGQEFTIGRIRVVMLDNRSDRTSSMIIGTAQRNWLYSVLDSVAEQGQALILNVGMAWVAQPGQGSDAADNWSSRAAQRTEIANAIASRGLTEKTLFIAGDAHMLAIDDGRNNTYATEWADGGPPIFHAAPLDSTSSTKGGPYSEGVITTTRQQYGIIEISDNGGNQINYTLRGFSLSESNGAETQRIQWSGSFILQSRGFSVQLVNNNNAPINGNVNWSLSESWDGPSVAHGTVSVSGGVLAGSGLSLAAGTYWLRYRSSGADEALSATVEVS